MARAPEAHRQYLLHKEEVEARRGRTPLRKVVDRWKGLQLHGSQLTVFMRSLKEAWAVHRYQDE